MKPTIMPYYFPNWHPTPMNDKWHGKNWTEWNVAKCALPRFEGHYQPKVPAWGYEDESKVEVMEKKVNYALENGVDGFIFDWYWFNEGGYRLDCIDNAFLPAIEGKDFKFAIMWCNHDPIYVHPGSYLQVKEGTTKLLDGNITKETFVEATNYCIEKYFTNKNYYRIDGKLYFSIYRMGTIIKDWGLEEFKKVIADFRDRVRKAGLGELNINASFGPSRSPFSSDEEAIAVLKEAGCDSVGFYNNTNGTLATELPFPYALYDEMCEASYKKYDALLEPVKSAGLDYYCTLATGWDVSPRTTQSDVYENIGYPYERIVNDSTPEKFEKWLKNRRTFCEENNIPLLTIFAWNEWTEGGYLEPDTKYGDGYAEAIKHVFKDK